MHIEKEGEVENLDEKNFENLVKFYEEELRRILRGESPVDVLTRSTRGKLRDASVLNYMNLTWTINDKATKYLR